MKQVRVLAVCALWAALIATLCIAVASFAYPCVYPLAGTTTRYIHLENGSVMFAVYRRDSRFGSLIDEFQFVRQTHDMVLLPQRWTSGGETVYALPLWLVVAGGLGLLLWWHRAIRNRGRLRRGLCPHCAYPIGASPVCSECGKPVPGRGKAVSI